MLRQAARSLARQRQRALTTTAPPAVASQQRARILVKSRYLATATDAVKPPSSNDSFATGNNAYYAEEMYRLWKEDPASVHPSWNVYFSGMSKGMRSEDAFRPPPSLLNLDEVGGDTELPLGGGGTNVDEHMKVSRSAPLFGSASVSS